MGDLRIEFQAPVPSYGRGRKKKALIFRQSKGNNSSIIVDTLITLVMAEDVKTDGWTDRQCQTYIPPNLVGDKKFK